MEILHFLTTQNVDFITHCGSNFIFQRFTSLTLLMDFLTISHPLTLRQFIKRDNYLLAHHMQHFAYVKLRHNVPDGPLLRRSEPAACAGAAECGTLRLQKDGGTDQITGDIRQFVSGLSALGMYIKPHDPGVLPVVMSDVDTSPMSH